MVFKYLSNVYAAVLVLPYYIVASNYIFASNYIIASNYDLLQIMIYFNFHTVFIGILKIK